MKRFMIFSITLILTLVITISPLASWLPDGSSLTIESDEGIMPAAYIGNTLGFFYANTTTTTDVFDFETTGNILAANGYIQPPFTYELPLPSRYVGASGTYYFPVQQGPLTATYVFKLNPADPALGGKYLSALAVVNNLHSSVYFNPDQFPMTGNSFYLPFISANSLEKPLLFGIRGSTDKKSSVDIYLAGTYPDISYLFSLSPNGVSAPPFYFNSIQVFAGNTNFGCVNGGLCQALNRFSILSDFVPPSGSLYTLEFFSNQGFKTTCNLRTGPVFSGVTEITPTASYQSVYRHRVNVRFDGNTKVSDLVFTVGNSASTTSFFFAQNPTLVLESYADFMLYDPSESGSGSGSCLDELKQAIEDADSHNVNAQQQAQDAITALQRALSQQQAQEHRESMSQAESIADVIENGYDVDPSAESANESLYSQIEEWNSVEESLQNMQESGFNALDSMLEPANYSDVVDGFQLVQLWINGLFTNGGIFQNVFTVSLVMFLLSMLFGAYKYAQSHGKKG